MCVQGDVQGGLHIKEYVQRHKKKDESIYYEYDYIILLSKDDLKRLTIKHTCRKKNGNHLKRVKCSNSIKEW